MLAAPSVRVTTDAPEATVAAFECNGLGLQNLPTRSERFGWPFIQAGRKRRWRMYSLQVLGSKEVVLQMRVIVAHRMSA